MKQASKIRGDVKSPKHLDYKLSDLTTKYLSKSANYEDARDYSIKRYIISHKSTIEVSK